MIEHIILIALSFLCFLFSCLYPALLLNTGQAIDCPLSETGLQQAEAAGCYLKDVTFSCVFVSDMLRAQQVQCFTCTVGAGIL